MTVSPRAEWEWLDGLIQASIHFEWTAHVRQYHGTKPGPSQMSLVYVGMLRGDRRGLASIVPK